MRLRTTLLTLLLIVFAAACAEDPEYAEGTEEGVMADEPAMTDQTLFGGHDADASGYLDENEFGEGFAEVGYYDRWDNDTDGQLTREEFGAGLYDTYDADGDGMLTEDEYGLFEDEYLSDYPGYTNTSTFGDYDTDASGDLTEDEFSGGFSNSDYFETWDTNMDQGLSEDEFGSGFYNVYDNDANRQLDENEYARYEEDWGV